MNWTGRKVVVTGADGFIGSHLVEMLLKEGAKVTALSYYNSFNYWGWLEDLRGSKGLTVVSGDVRDAEFCRGLVSGADTVFHLAALIAIPYSYRAPESYVDTNVSGTLHICQAALEHKCRRVVHTSTSEVYGTAQRVPIGEDHPLQPQSPYSASKIGADAMAMSFYHAFDLPLAIARPFNTYGPRQSARAVIPSVIIQIANGAKEVRLGDVRPTRDFNYVEDVCHGFLAIAGSDKTVGETVNIGSGTEVSIKEVFEKIRTIMGRDVVLVKEKERLRPKKSEVLRLCCDSTKIKRLANYKSQVGLEEGLRRTVAWFSDPAKLARYKADLYNV